MAAQQPAVSAPHSMALLKSSRARSHSALLMGWRHRLRLGQHRQLVTHRQQWAWGQRQLCWQRCQMQQQRRRFMDSNAGQAMPALPAPRSSNSSRWGVSCPHGAHLPNIAAQLLAWQACHRCPCTSCSVAACLSRSHCPWPLLCMARMGLLQAVAAGQAAQQSSCSAATKVAARSASQLACPMLLTAISSSWHSQAHIRNARHLVP